MRINPCMSTVFISAAATPGGTLKPLQRKDKSVKQRTRLVPLLPVLFLAPWIAVDPGSARADQTAGVGQAAELWRQGSDQALAGDFLAAANTFQHVLKLDPSDQRARLALDWTNTNVQGTQRRDELRRKTYHQHLEAAQTLMERKKWATAIDQVRLASYNTETPGDLLALAWFRTLRDQVLERIKEHRAKSEWLDALVLYDTLAFLHKDHPEEAEYKKEVTYCRQRAHFEAMYGSKNNWQDDLADIQTGIVEEVLQRINRDHFETPDFRRMMTSALENMLIMAQTPKLTETFPQMKDAAAVADFIARLKEQSARIERKERVSVDDAIECFDRMMRINRETLKLRGELLAYEFLNGAMLPLDEFSSVIWPSEVENFEKHTQGEFNGVGIQITKQEGAFIRVETPLEDSPAFDAGISPGDLITAIDGKSTKDLKLNDAVHYITGPEGTSVELTFERPGESEPFRKNLKRTRIRIRSVKGFARTHDRNDWDFMIDPDNHIGYVRISQFTRETKEELRKALTQVRARGGKGVILDLRFDPGGLLTSAIEVCSLFLDAGQAVVKTEGRGHTEQRPAYRVDRDGEFDDLGPVIILVNEQSASASEILAGTLAGNHKAFVIGERSFGKGSVQNLYEVADRTAYFKLTTALYYVPTDPRGQTWRCLHRNEGDKTWGVEPHMSVKLIPNELVRVFELRRRSETISKINREVPEELFKRPPSPTTQPADDIEIPNEAPYTDPQLETALSVMRIKLLSNQPWAMSPVLPAQAAADPNRRTTGG